MPFLRPNVVTAWILNNTDRVAPELAKALDQSALDAFEKVIMDELTAPNALRATFQQIETILHGINEPELAAHIAARRAEVRDITR